MSLWLDWNAPVFQMALDVAIRSVVLAAAVAAILFLARIRSSHVRHRAWTGVLLAMLLMPLLTRIAPPIDVPFLPPVFLEPAPRLAEEPISAVDVVDRSAAALPNDPGVSSSSAIQTAPVPARAEGHAGNDGTGSVRRSIYPTLLFGVYVIGAGILMLRLMAGWLAMRRLIRSSRAVVVLDRTPVYESDAISTPVTSGILRPLIVLPREWRQWRHTKLQAAMVHEKVHIAHRDALVGFVARVNRVLFWWHPLAWWLQRMLATTAEQACDDAVVRATGDSKGYVAMLIEIAEAVRRRGSRLSWQELGVRGTGLLQHRIERLLRGNIPPHVSMARRMAVTVLCVTATYLAVACRQAQQALPEVRTAEQHDPAQVPEPEGETGIIDPNAASARTATADANAIPIDGRPTGDSGNHVVSSLRTTTDPLTITSAIYGARGGAADVTPLVRLLARPERDEFYVAPAWLEVDPVAGQSKTLMVTYRYHDRDYVLSTEEPGAVSHAILVAHANRALAGASSGDVGVTATTSGRGRLVIADAYYGMGRRYRPIAPRLRQLLRPDSDPIRVDDAVVTVSRGLARGSLIVTSVYEGRRTTFVARSGTVISYARLVEAATSGETNDVYSTAVPAWRDLVEAHPPRAPGDRGPGQGQSPFKEQAIASLLDALGELDAIAPADRTGRVAAATATVRQALADAQINIGYEYPRPSSAPIVVPVEAADASVHVSRAVEALASASRSLNWSTPRGPNAQYRTTALNGIDRALTELRGDGDVRVSDEALINGVKQSNVHSIDPTLPSVTFDDWLRGIVGTSRPTTWVVNDCGEQTGDPAIDRNRDMPMCVEVRVTLEDASDLSLSLMVGTWRTGVAGPPSFRSGFLTETDGRARPIDSLSTVATVATRRVLRFPPIGDLPIVSGPGYEGAIIPASSPSHSMFFIGLMESGMSRADTDRFTAWTPTPSDIALVERHVAAFVALAATASSPVIEGLSAMNRRSVLAGLPWLAANIQTLKRNYYGIKEGDVRRILVRGFLDRSDRWRSQAMFLMSDGGCANVWFDVNLDEQRVIGITCGASA